MPFCLIRSWYRSFYSPVYPSILPCQEKSCRTSQLSFLPHQLKQSIARITNELLPDAIRYGLGGIVAIPHDEIILDVPEEVASQIAKEVSTTMMEVANKMCPGMKFRADPTICRSWAEKE